ncbi:MAG: hypothetical protein P8N02_17895 [Actinomycetota bacterium]|jgi:hypothetical protein|nr:hypothetical protein [Actinomycetota bacterium]
MIDPTLLVLERIHHYRDTIRRYHVEIDGERLGQVRDDDRIAFEVDPGEHSVRLKLMWISSPTYLVDVPAGGEAYVRCGPNGGLAQAWRLFLAPTTAIFVEAGSAPDTSSDTPDGDDLG